MNMIYFPNDEPKIYDVLFRWYANMTTKMPEDTYSFSGWLIFNGLYFTEVHDEEFSPASLIEQLPQYTEGTPKNQTEGYREIELSAHFGEVGDLSGGLSNLAEDLYTFEHVTENWVRIPGVNEEGNANATYQGRHKTLQIFWNYEDIMIFRGPKTMVEQKKKQIHNALSNAVRIEELDFDFDFL